MAVIGYPCHMSALDATVRAASSAGGQILNAATGMLTARPAAKPLHPRGSVVHGTLHRFGAEDSTGASWIDQTGEDDVLVRQSRAVGLPAPLPDIFGLAIRVPTEGGSHGDLLLASTGLGAFTTLLLHTDPVDEADMPVSFEPVRHPLPGLETYDWVRRLREPAYATARRSRGF